MTRRWISTKDDARCYDLELRLRRECQSRRGIAWLSTRLLCHQMLYRDGGEVRRLRRLLLAQRRIFYVTAHGRGQGRGRTLYWLPGTSQRVVLRALREEAMPDAAISAAKALFLHPKNEMEETQQEPLRTVVLVATHEKGRARAPDAHFQAPSGPPRPPAKPQTTPSASPSLGRLVKHGFKPLSRVAAQLSVIRDDPATHPHDCECGAHAP